MKYKATFLIDKKNNWIEKYLKSYNFKNKKKFKINIKKNPNNIKNQDLVLPLSYTKLLSKKFLKSNILTIIAHPSKLPRDRGWAPLAYQILRKQNYFHLTLIRANIKADTGDICLQKKIKLRGDELSEELRKIQATEIFKLIDKLFKHYPKLKFRKQVGKSSYNPRRLQDSNIININKSIKSQFNLLRISDDKLYPAFFYYKKKKFILKINKS